MPRIVSLKTILTGRSAPNRRQRAEAIAERRWVGVAVAVLLAAIALPRPADMYDDSSVRFLSAEAAADPLNAPRVSVSPLELNRLSPSAFGD